MNNGQNELNTFTQVSDEFERCVAEAREARSQYAGELVSKAFASIGMFFSFSKSVRTHADAKFGH